MNFKSAIASFVKKFSGIPISGNARASSFLHGDNNCLIRIDRDVFFTLYTRNGDIRACISNIAKKSGVNGLYLENKDGSVEESDDIQNIFSAPTWYNFKLELLKYSMICGEVFIVPIYNGLSQVVGFRFLDPRTMVKYYNAVTDELTGFIQYPTYQQSNPISFSKDEIFYTQFEKDPNDNFNGLSLLEGVVYDAMSDKEITERNFGFIKNNMMPDGIVILDKEFDKDELENAKRVLESELSGSSNSRKLLINNTVKDIKTLSLSPREVDFINQRRLSIEKVCATFGVPKSILGYVDDVNRANADSARITYIENTIRPTEEYIAYIINSIYEKFVSDDLAKKKTSIKLDGESTEDILALHTDQRADIERGVYSIDEVREERGRVAWGMNETKNPLISSNIAPLGMTPTQTK